LLCLIGTGTLMFPWAHAAVWAVDPTPQADGSYIAKGLPVAVSFPGYRFWHASAGAIGFFALFLTLLVTEPISPIPLWRTVVLLVGAASIVGVVLVGLNYRHAVLQSDFKSGHWVVPEWGVMNYVALGLAAALVLVSAWELRSRIVRSHRERAEHDGEGRTTGHA
jgi:hypothetical protein